MYRAVVTALVWAIYLSAQTPPPQVLFRQAAALQKSGDVAGAIETYRRLLAVDPHQAAALSNLGILLAHSGQYDEAITEYRKALALLPGNANIETNLGLAYYKSGRMTEAARVFAQARAQAPGDLQLALLAADCDLRMGQNDAVITTLEPLERRNPDNLAIAYLLGTALIRDHRAAEGQRLIDFISRHDDPAAARYLLGSERFEAGDYPAAVKELASAAEADPKLPGLQSLYGQALLITGDPDGAAAAFREALAADPNDFEANLRLGQILIERKRASEAEPLLKRALRVRGDSAESLAALGEAQAQQGKLGEAKTNLKRAEASGLRSLELHRELASVYSSLHLTSDAARERELAAAMQAKLDAANHRPVAGSVAPEFRATRLHSHHRASLDRLRGHGPVLLVFGSYTCPNFRAAAPALNKLYDKYKSKLPFYLVYIREAHANGQWQSTRNERQGVSLAPAKNMPEKMEHAAFCIRKLRIDFPALVDGTDGEAERAYAAWPSRAYLIDATGRIAYSSGLTEQDFNAGKWEAMIKKQVAGRR